MRDHIKQFVIQQLEKKQALPKDINIDDYPFIDDGHIDSMGIMGFIIALENEFHIELSQEEISSEAFRRVGSLTILLETKIT